MSTTTHTAENDCGVGEQYDRRETFEGITWRHRETGLEVEAAKWSRPTQMSAPQTAGKDDYWRLVARHEGTVVEIAEISAGSHGREQSGKEVIVKRAREWMCAHLDGQLEADR